MGVGSKYIFFFFNKSSKSDLDTYLVQNHTRFSFEVNIMQQVKRKRIAVIGGGISGMGAAQMLGDTHSVTLLEAAPRLGGHARTVVAGKSGDQPVDTGFIVFNYANYPHLVKMFEQLNVPVVKSNMSFGASQRRRDRIWHNRRSGTFCATQQFDLAKLFAHGARHFSL